MNLPWTPDWPRLPDARMGPAVDADHLTVEASQLVEDAGEVWTTLRAATYGALLGFDRPASAYELADAATALTGRRVYSHGVYRTLTLFVGLGIARRVESAKGYLAEASPRIDPDRVTMFCGSCGRTHDVAVDGFSARVSGRAASVGFRPARLIAEASGLCRGCVGAGPTA